VSFKDKTVTKFQDPKQTIFLDAKQI